MSRTDPLIGVLALQGAYREHLQTLDAIGVEGVPVRLPEDLEGVSGLILPGGESTTMRHLIERWGLAAPILGLAATGAPLHEGVRMASLTPARIAGVLYLGTDHFRHLERMTQ